METTTNPETPTVKETTMSRHRVAFRKGDTTLSVDVVAPKDADAVELIAKAKQELGIYSTWTPQSVSLIRRDGSVQRTVAA